MLTRALHRLPPVARLGDHLDVLTGTEDHPQARAHQRIVIDHQHPDHRASSPGVGAPGNTARSTQRPDSGPASSVPPSTRARSASDAKPVPCRSAGLAAPARSPGLAGPAPSRSACATNAAPPRSPGTTSGLAIRMTTAPWASLVTLTSAERSEEHTSELQSRGHLVCRLLLEKKKRRR